MTAYRVAISPSSFAAEDDTPIKMLEAAGCEVVPNPFGRRLTEDEIIEHLKGIDGLIAGLEPLNRNVLSTAPQLKALARVGIGMTNVDIPAAEELGIKVSNTPDGPVQAVAELTMTALLATLRNLVSANAALHDCEWKKEIGSGLLGKKVLLVGYGRIGRKVGEFLAAFGADISIYDPFLTDRERRSHRIQFARRIEQRRSRIPPRQWNRLHSGRIRLRRHVARHHFAESRTRRTRGRNRTLQGPGQRRDRGRAGSMPLSKNPIPGPSPNTRRCCSRPIPGPTRRNARLGMESAAVENLLRDLGVSA